MQRVKFKTRRGQVVSFNARTGKNRGKRRRTAYQTFVAKKVRAATKKVSTSRRVDVAQKTMVAAAKEWKKKKQKRKPGRR